MKVVAFNGSPRENGNTFLAIQAVLSEIEAAGIDTEIIQVGDKNIQGCTACGACRKNNCDCVFADQEFLTMTEAMYSADGIILGAPVYFSGIPGTFKSFLDRAFYQCAGRLRHKVGATLAVPRRSGGVTVFDQLNNYILFSEMIVASSYYWNVAHGATPGQISEDLEGMCILKNLGRNMAWILKMKEQTKDTVARPSPVERKWMNFIR